MTAKRLMIAALTGKCVTGFHQNCNARHYMPAAFLVAMPFRLVMSVVPRLKIYKPRKKK